MKPEVSVLVAIYNTSVYIERCVHSLFKQTFQDIEFIFVNDASTDDSIYKLEMIIKEYPLRKHQVRIVHHAKNKGLAVVRNTALKASTGKYISVVDSDDYIELDMIEQLYQTAKDTDADIVVADLIKEYRNKSVKVIDSIGGTREESFYYMLVNKKSHSYLCNKMIRRELYEKSGDVPEGLNYWEDRYTMTRVYYYAKNIVKLNKSLYHYVQYNESAITKSVKEMQFKNVLMFWNLQDLFLENNKIYNNYKEEIGAGKVKTKIRLMIDTNSSSLRKKYATMFLKEEEEYEKYFKTGERIMLFLVRKGYFFLAQLYHNLLLIKSGKWRQIRIY